MKQKKNFSTPLVFFLNFPDLLQELFRTKYRSTRLSDVHLDTSGIPRHPAVTANLPTFRKKVLSHIGDIDGVNTFSAKGTAGVHQVGRCYAKWVTGESFFHFYI